MKRTYLEVTPGPEPLVSKDIPEVLASLYKLDRREERSVSTRLNPLSRVDPPTFEFVAISEGENLPVEFFYGVDAQLEALEQRLRNIYPPSYDVDRVEVDLTRKLLDPSIYELLVETQSSSEGEDPTGSLHVPEDNLTEQISKQDVQPVGIEWFGNAARRKDWMTTLTGFTDLYGRGAHPEDDQPGRRLPIVTLLEGLVECPHPIAYQVVFQRKADWSRDARRRSGELLAGEDTLVQKFLGMESPGPRRALTTPAYDAQTTPLGIEQTSRYEQVLSNTPDRTFTVNVRLFAFVASDPDRVAVTDYLEPLCSIFDLVDGQYYEIEGQHISSNGLLPRSSNRQARRQLEIFSSRSVVCGGSRFSITNRREVRPDLVLNGNELANFVIIPESVDRLLKSVDLVEANESSEDYDQSEDSFTPSGSGSEAGKSSAEFGEFTEKPSISRDAEVAQLTDVLEPIAQGRLPETLIISGPPGSGKTHIVNRVVGRILEEAPEANGAYVNCWEDRSRFQVLFKILEAVDSTLDIHRQSTPRDVLLDRIREYEGPPSVVVLDEVDQLEERNLLYDLLNLPRFGFILLLNQEGDFFDGLDERLISRLSGCEIIHFDRYDSDQLVEILKNYQEEVDGSNFSTSELKYIASLSGGDARVAITTLRIAERRWIQDSELPAIGAISSALPEAHQQFRSDTIDSLNSHQLKILQIIQDEGRISPSDLYSKYRKQVQKPKTDRTVRNYLRKLEQYELISSIGTTRDRNYQSLFPKPD